MEIKINVKNKKEKEKLKELLIKNNFKFKKPKKPGSGQKKGKRFEKEIAKELSLWWTNNKRNDIFYLTSGSGSRFTIRKKSGQDTANSSGDIGLLDPIGQPFLNLFQIEVKRGYTDDLDLLSIIDGKDQKYLIFDWIEKAIHEQQEAKKKEILLIIKRDRKEKIVCVNTKFLESNYFFKCYSDKEIIMIPFIKKFNNKEFSIIDYNVFFKLLSPKAIIKGNLNE